MNGGECAILMCRGMLLNAAMHSTCTLPIYKCTWKYEGSGAFHFLQIYSQDILLRCNNLWTIVLPLEIFGLLKYNICFFYLTIRKMCRIADRLARRGLLHPEQCVLCDWRWCSTSWLEYLFLLNLDCTTCRPPLAWSPQCLGGMWRGSQRDPREKLYDKLTSMHIVK